MQRLTSVLLFVLSAAGTSAGAQVAGVQLPGSAGSLPAGTRVTVQMTDSVTATNPTAQYNGSVLNLMDVAGFTVPAGTPAVVKVVTNPGKTPSYSLALVSLVVNGQSTPVSGGAPTVSAVGNMMNSASNVVNATLANLMSGNPKSHQKAAPAQKPAVTGTKLYVPTGTAVMFTLAGVTQLPKAPQTASATGGSTPPAAGGPSAGGVASSSPPPAAGPSVPAAANASGATGSSSSTVVYESIQYQLTACQREAPHIICQLQITNMRAVDAQLNGAGGTYYVDQSGNKVGASNRSIANCIGYGWCQLLPGIAMAGRFEFMDEEGHATTLVRLLIAENGKPVAQFSGVPIQ